MRRTLAVLITIAGTLASCTTPHASAVASTASPTTAPVQTSMARDDRIRIAETYRLAAALGDQLWPRWTSAPFAILLVTPDRELLVHHPRPTADFTRIGYDSLLQSDVYARARTLSTSFLATFPAVGGVPTIVVGQPAATHKSSTMWVLTLMHEHFHQLQMSQPGYYSGVAALGLARGDQTGMWQLNFPFPYDSSAVIARFGDLTRALNAALDSSSASASTARWRAVTDARTALHAALTTDDDKYLSFQMWQEGAARYTELHVARWATEHYAPSVEFRALPDVTSFGVASSSLDSTIRAELRANDLVHSRRALFYPVGAATALLLDRVAPDWRVRYFERGYSLDGMLH